MKRRGGEEGEKGGGGEFLLFTPITPQERKLSEGKR